MPKEGKEFKLNTSEQILRFECCECSLCHDFEFNIKNEKEIGIMIKLTNEKDIKSGNR
jgi:hypothetical protein